MSVPAMTTEAKVALRLSTAGVSLRADHAAAGLVLAEAISQASCDAAVFLAQRYALAALPDSDVVSNWVADIAVYHLCRVRANPVPASVMKRYEEVVEQLKELQAGKGMIPDLPNPTAAPAVVNHTVRYDQHPSKRVVGGMSEPRGNAGYPRYPDYREPFKR